MTKAEREHLAKVKEWAAAQRATQASMHVRPEMSRLMTALEKLAPDAVEQRNRIFDNLDWLIATLEREDGQLRHRTGVRALTRGVEAHMVRELPKRWRKEADGVQAMGYSQQADRMRDCATELEQALK